MADDSGTDGNAVDSATDGTDPEAAVERFLDRADGALAEYDSGYGDADATLRVLRDALADLRDVTED